MTQRLLFFITWYIINGCASPEYLPTADDYHVIPFRSVGNRIPVIKAMLNDKIAWFIVDTGASITLLNETEAKYFGFSMNNNPRIKKTELSGFSDQLVLAQTSICRMQIGQLKILQRVYRAVGMNSLFITIEDNEKLKIGGIIGSDILARYGMNVSYETRTISYRIKKVLN